MTTAAVTEQRTAAPTSNLYLAFVPWILFAFVTHRETLIAGSVVALVAALFIAGRSLRTGPKMPEIAAVVTFAGFTVAALMVDAGTAETIARYGRAIAAGILALVAFGSLLGTPFTEQYARETVPRELWSSPGFHAVNRTVTAIWGLTFALMVPAHILAGAIDTPHANLLLNWAVPVGLIVWAANRTEQAASAARA